MLATKTAKAPGKAHDGAANRPAPAAFAGRARGGPAIWPAAWRGREVDAKSEPSQSPAWDFAKIPLLAPQAKLAVADVSDPLEREADRIADQVMGARSPAGGAIAGANIVPATGPTRRLTDVPEGSLSGLGAGAPLAPSVRAELEPRFGHDFSGVRVHTGPEAHRSAGSLGALAYAFGPNLVFRDGRYAPHASEGRRLLAHELAHVIQQGHSAARLSNAGVRTGANGAASGAMIQRTVEMRDVGSGDQSGFSRLPELIDRLNAMSQGLTFSVTAGGAATWRVRDYANALVQGNQTVELQATPIDGATPTHFETRMAALIDPAAGIIPLRLTNRHGLLGTVATGFNTQVDADAWTSGYVDIDDLLASTDLGLQSVLLHFLTERSATPRYSHRIGTTTFTNAEFQRVHDRGIDAEAALLQDFFGDPSIHIVNDSPSATVRRVFRNDRRDLIRRMIAHGTGANAGVDASSIDVVTHDGRHMSADDYRLLPH